ncbi:MAG: ABC transporter ATP-binding protein [Chloroflexota bacterium]|nr:ABC transporter ATP-binding protein [Chloroflexota bacterium]MDE2920332.1 ABC transporter ATP-binding protein [Chloroflexota bacterium]
MTAFLEMTNVSKVFSAGIIRRQHTVAVDDVTMTIDEQSPSILAVAGESGSGKTTLARLLLGVIPPSSGEVIYRGQSVDDLSRAQRRTYLREIQPIFQDPFESYNPFYKVDHVLTVPAKKFDLAASREQTMRLIEEALDMVGLQPAETLGRFPHQLSGGQRQRVMVARAMLLRPRLIVADEPVSMVDASLRATILESIRRMKQELGISVVYITHDLTTAYQIADNILVMYKGSVVEAGSVEQVIRDPKHPYTQLLVSSIPQPDPSLPWGAEGEIAGDPESMEVAATGCKFVDRCPVAFEPCSGQRPPLYHEHPSRAAACFQYDGSPALEGQNLDVVFEPQLTSQAAGGSQEPAAN